MPCDRLRPIVLRAAEGEATPEEALRAGRHLAECTACRIVAARERRLTEALADLPDSIDVDDGFVGRLMTVLATMRVSRASSGKAGPGLRAVGRRLTTWFLPAALAAGGLAHSLSGPHRALGTWRAASAPSPDAGAWPLDLLATAAAAVTGLTERSALDVVPALPSPTIPVVLTVSSFVFGAGLLALALAVRGLAWPDAKRLSARRILEVAFRAGSS